MIVANVSEGQGDPDHAALCVECDSPTPAKIVLGFSGSEVRNALCSDHLTELEVLLSYAK
jgi:hypothetical protein